MAFQQSLQDAWRRFWKLSKQRHEPLWARFLIGTGIGLFIALVLAVVVGLFEGHLLSARWAGRILLPATFVAVCVAWFTQAAYRLMELLLPQHRIDQFNGKPGLLSSLFFSALSIVAALLGWFTGLQLLGALLQQDIWSKAWRGAPSLLQFALVSALMCGAWGFWALVQWRQQQLKLQATEAQLKLLQAQIEPHFLFNTLANVRSLIDCEPQRAGELLDLFTDHLRSSLSAMRSELVPLERELELVSQYLRLMQLRMCERLHFEIDASPEARAVALPPLLLQPLVENAIQHGLECQVEGGHVQIRAELRNGCLHVSVRDDGQGLDGPRRRDRKGNGVALANIRERLCSRYGDAAQLTLQAAQPRGTEALIQLPLSLKP